MIVIYFFDFRFVEQKLDHVFASPFDRTVETATRLIGDRGIPIKVEPGLAEVCSVFN